MQDALLDEFKIKKNDRHDDKLGYAMLCRVCQSKPKHLPSMTQLQLSPSNRLSQLNGVLGANQLAVLEDSSRHRNHCESNEAEQRVTPSDTQHAEHVWSSERKHSS